jgi:hypothetical protein
VQSTFEKLNLKSNTSIVVLSPPESFEAEFTTLQNVAVLCAS